MARPCRSRRVTQIVAAALDDPPANRLTFRRRKKKSQIAAMARNNSALKTLRRRRGRIYWRLRTMAAAQKGVGSTFTLGARHKPALESLMLSLRSRLALVGADGTAKSALTRNGAATYNYLVTFHECRARL